MPPPDAGDFRVVLGDEEKERVKRMVVRMVDGDPRGEILVKGAPRSRLRICGAFVGFANRFDPLPLNHEWPEWLCALLHSLLASRLSVIPNIPRDPRRSWMAP